MRQKSVPSVTSSEQVVKYIRRATRKQYSAEEKIRIVLDEGQPHRRTPAVELGRDKQSKQSRVVTRTLTNDLLFREP